MTVVKPFQNRTENAMFGHPTWNAFALLSSIRRLLNDNTYSRVITLSATGKVTKIRSILDSVRMIPMTDPCVVELSNLEDMWKKGMKQNGLSRVTVGESLVPHIEPSFFWFTEIKITHDDADNVRIRKPMWA